MQPHIGCAGEAHILQFSIFKIAGSKMSAFWRPVMADAKVLHYLERTLAGGLGMDTAGVAVRGSTHWESLQAPRMIGEPGTTRRIHACGEGCTVVYTRVGKGAP
jgi:hypothetical protein